MFAIAQQKAKLELQAANTKVCHNGKKNLAKIAAICAPANIYTLVSSIQTIVENEKVSINEISTIILSVAGCYLGLPKAKITQIYKNYVKPENFCKFCNSKGYKDTNKDENIIFDHS